MPNNTGQFAERVEALRLRLETAQQRLAGVAKQQNGLLESLARNELSQQKERISTYQIQARFALASIYDRAALGGGSVATPKEGGTESQGDLEVVPSPAPSGDTPPSETPPSETPPSETPPAEPVPEPAPGANTAEPPK
jgi:hypothetical protein